jgi:AraC-like DNA-binding protein
MKPKVEPLRLLPDESFRLLRWNELDITEVEAIGADGKSYPFKGAGDVWHCHPGMELVLITRGAGTRFVGDSITEFRVPDLVLLGSNLPHCWRTQRPLSGYAVQFGLGPEHAFWTLPETNDLSDLWRSAQKGIQLTGPLAQDAAELIQSMPEHWGVGRLARLLLVLEKFQHATRESWSLLSQKNFPPAQDESTYRGVQKAVQMILHSFHEELTLADLVQAAGMSKATFERQFKNHTGKTFTRFLAEVRIDSARRQLLETDGAIGEIAFASGFNNLSHFNHQFALVHGESPGAFRRKMKTPAGRADGAELVPLAQGARTSHAKP